MDESQNILSGVLTCHMEALRKASVYRVRPVVDSISQIDADKLSSFTLVGYF